MSMTTTELISELGAILVEHGDVELDAHVANVRSEVTGVAPTEARPVWIDSDTSH